MQWSFISAAGTICLLLSACIAVPDQASNKADQKPVPQIDARDEAGNKPAVTDERTQTATRSPGPSPEKLVGMTNDDIMNIFGRPVFVRRDPPGEFWRYRSKTCILELFFYQRGGAWRVDHLEMRRNDTPVADRPACVTALRARTHNG